MIRHAGTPKNVSPDNLRGGFFENWPNPLSLETHPRILKERNEVGLALDGPDIVGFVTAITDGVLCACLPCWKCCPATGMMPRRREDQTGRGSPGAIY